MSSFPSPATPNPKASQQRQGDLLEAGLSAIRQGRIDAAVDALTRAAELGPNHPVLHNLGVALARLGRLDEAVSRSEEALRLKPSAGDTRRNLALAYRQRGNHQAAAATLAAVVEGEPAAPDARMQLGQLLLGLDQAEEAATMVPSSSSFSIRTVNKVKRHACARRSDVRNLPATTRPVHRYWVLSYP
jgi:Flp pilus assembly protein TadD